jgi:hypothetical protein
MVRLSGFGHGSVTLAQHCARIPDRLLFTDPRNIVSPESEIILLSLAAICTEAHDKLGFPHAA